MLRLVLAACAALLPVACAAAATLPAGQPLTAEIAREMVLAALPESPPGERWDVQLTTRGFPLPNHARTDGWMEIESLDIQRPSGRLDASLKVTLEGGEAGVIALRGRAESQIELPVLLRSIPRGGRISESDLTSRWISASRVPADAVFQTADAVGQEAHRRLGPGRVLRTADIRPPRLVQADEPVTLVFRRRGLDLTTGGTALDAGMAGDSVRVVNPSSNRPIRGIVVGPRRVQVGPFGGNGS